MSSSTPRFDVSPVTREKRMLGEGAGRPATQGWCPHTWVGSCRTRVATTRRSHLLCRVLWDSPAAAAAPTYHFPSHGLAARPVPGAAHLTFLACGVSESRAIFNLWQGHSAPLPVNTAQMTVWNPAGAAGSARGPAIGPAPCVPCSAQGGLELQEASVTPQHMGAEDAAVTETDPRGAGQSEKGTASMSKWQSLRP